MSSNRKSKTVKPSKPKVSVKATSRKATASAKLAPQPAPIRDVPTTVPPTCGSDVPSAASASKPLSGLEAAVIVLREASAPLNANDLVGLMLKRGLWKTEGKTPAATIFAAMSREIQSKGLASRFLKAEPGRFTVAG